MLVKSLGGLSMSLTVGVVTWVMHGGSMVISLLSSATVLKGFDPMPLFDGRRRYQNGEQSDDNNNDARIDEMFDGDSVETESGNTESREENRP
jgi:hypothetical protein